MCAKILLLLELPENSLQVKESLEHSGHQVVWSKTFTTAIEVLQQDDIQLVISDVHLENGGNVFDFLLWVKGNPRIKQIPFVLFSSKPTIFAKYLEDGVRTSARLLGAAKYITMDRFNSDEFRKQINSLLETKNAITPGKLVSSKHVLKEVGE